MASPALTPSGPWLGVDYGDRRVGLAVSDRQGVVATPAGTLEGGSVGKVAEALAAEVAGRQAVGVIIGLPLNMNGSAGPRADLSRQLAESLRAKVAVPVRLWDERLTTRGIERMFQETGARRGKRKELVDTLSAQQILQSWLEAQPAP